MITSKVSLTIALPGRTMFSKQECLKNPNPTTCYDSHKLTVEDKKHEKSTIIFRTRKSRPAYQTINLSEEAYKYMTEKSANAQEDKKNTPEWSIPSQWCPLSPKQRLEAHLNRICQSLGGELFTYSVLGD